MARLKGHTNICSLIMKCPGDTCTETMSYIDSTILLALVKGLHDEVTKGEILSKVEQWTRTQPSLSWMRERQASVILLS